MGDGVAPIRDGTADSFDSAVVGIVDNASSATCTGALIAPNLVLSAQHCVAQVMNIGPCTQGTFGPPGPAGNYYVTTKAMIGFNPSDFHRAVEVVVPPGSGICGRDIVLLRLGTSIDSSEAVPIDPRLDPPPAVAEVYSAVGYGATDDMGTGAGERRRRDGLAVACVGDGCASTYIGLAEWQGEAGVCQGDSGGPALDGTGAVLGVASRGAVGCINPVYGLISAHRDWLISEGLRAANLGGYAPPPWTGGGPPVDAGVDAPADPIDAATDAPAGPDAGTGVDDPEGGGCCGTTSAPSPALIVGVLLALLIRRRGSRPICGSRRRTACCSTDRSDTARPW